jgi:hypothetical protein
MRVSGPRGTAHSLRSVMKKLTIAAMTSLASARGGRCLSTSYANSVRPLLWQCAAGHHWSALPATIRKGSWCPRCARVAPLTLQEMRRMAAGKSGWCLSLEYAGSSNPLRWRCAAGHEWDARPASIRSGNWCPFCARNRKLDLEEMREIARERGGKCLSAVYKNGRTALLWECKKGHRWKARPANVKGGARKRGSWCLACYNSRRVFHLRQNIYAMTKLAFSRGGKCISDEYWGSKTKLTWECERGHHWQATPATIIQGTWCNVCARNQRLDLRAMRKIAASRGGDCLSQTYTNERTVLTWYCAAGHRWRATPGKVKRGSWCPSCAGLRRRRSWAALPATQPVQAPVSRKRSQRVRRAIGSSGTKVAHSG